MPFLEQMIAQLDQPDIFMVPQRRPLKYVLAQDILPALKPRSPRARTRKTRSRRTRPAAQTSNQRPDRQRQAQRQRPTRAAVPAAARDRSRRSRRSLQAPTENNVPTVVTIGKTRLLADNRSNSIIVFGSPDVVARVFDMIDQLDRKPLQVYLATVIGELTVTEGQEFGIDILQKFQRVGQGGIADQQLNRRSARSTASANSSRSRAA